MKRKNYGPKGQKVKDPAGMLVPRHERIEVNEETCKSLIEDGKAEGCREWQVRAVKDVQGRE